MPILNSSELNVPFYLFNQHLETIVPSTIRKVNKIEKERVRLNTPDEDFIDVDTYKSPGNKRALIVSHGLEGSSDRPYVLALADLFVQNRWDVFAWNCRSCSGEMNRQFRLYHHGDIDDLSLVTNWLVNQSCYEEIVMVGFSMGGSMTLRYLGMNGSAAPQKIKKAVVFSVPVDLKGCSEELERPFNILYKRKFIRKLSEKIVRKNAQYPGRLNMAYLKKVKRIRDFDEYFTAPMYGFSGADDFYHRAQSKPFIEHIKIPTLLVNALNDPFLPVSCYPYDIAQGSEYVYLETPKRGGHVGFLEFRQKYAWSERRALLFAEE